MEHAKMEALGNLGYYALEELFVEEDETTANNMNPKQYRLLVIILMHLDRNSAAPSFISTCSSDSLGGYSYTSSAFPATSTSLFQWLTRQRLK
jgi:hypothetical protein